MGVLTTAGVEGSKHGRVRMGVECQVVMVMGVLTTAGVEGSKHGRARRRWVSGSYGHGRAVRRGSNRVRALAYVRKNPYICSILRRFGGAVAAAPGVSH